MKATNQEIQEALITLGKFVRKHELSHGRDCMKKYYKGARKNPWSSKNFTEMFKLELGSKRLKINKEKKFIAIEHKDLGIYFYGLEDKSIFNEAMIFGEW